MDEYKLVHEGILDGEFEGFNEDVLFKLFDGSAWIQDEYRYWYCYCYCPKIKILKKDGRLFIKVDDFPQMVPVRQLFNVIESKIDGEFLGWEGDTRYRLINGQIWEQVEYKYEYKYAYMPAVFIYQGGSGSVMQVQGTNAKVRRMR